MKERVRRIVDRGTLAAALAAAGMMIIGCPLPVPESGNLPSADAANPVGGGGRDAGGVDAAATGADAGAPQSQDAGAVQLGTVVVRATIGSGPGQIGVDTAEEAWQAGPMSFALAPTGEIFVLDQVNSRINVYSNGSFLRSVSIGGTTYVDMDLMNSNGFVLLDNLVQKKVVVLNTVGAKVNEVPLLGTGIPNPAAAVRVQYRGDGIWVETVDGYSVHVADSAGSPTASRAVVRGAFTWDSARLMRGSVLGDITANVTLSEADKVTWNSHPVHYRAAISNLLGLYNDASGKFYLGTVFLDAAGAEASGAELTVLNSSGDVVKRTPMFAQTRTEAVHRSLRVTGEGTAYQLALDDQGVAIRRYP